MALFCINRYGGEEEQEEKGAEAEERARVLLERLRQQAKARQLRKQQEQEAQPEGGEGDLPGGAGPGAAGLSPGGEAWGGRRKRKGESEERARAQGQKKLKKKQQSGSSSEEWADAEEAAGGSTPSKKKKENRRKSKVPQEKTEADSEEDIKQQENRSNFNNKPSKRKKRDAETEEAETRKKDNSGRAEGDQSTKAELSLRASEEEARPPPSSLVVLGDYDRKPVQKVQPFLPQWLAQPKLVQKRIKDNLVPIREVPGIHPRLLKKLQMNGIESFFPVQAEVIPAILQSASNGYLVGQGGYRPKDICVSAPTGSGKTLSFVIPIVQVLLHRVVCQVRALVVLPTKELAQQSDRLLQPGRYYCGYTRPAHRSH